MKIVTFGSMSLPNGRLDITDPGYEPGIWCSLCGLRVVKGLWEFGVFQDRGLTLALWGRVVSEDSLPLEDGEMQAKTPIIRLGVDSGRMAIMDHDARKQYPIELIRDSARTEGLFSCPRWSGTVGVSCRSGQGDGAYWLTAHLTKGTSLPDQLLVEF